MRLSIWDIYHSLGYDNMLPMVQSGSATIRNARLIASASPSEDAVYVTQAAEYLGSDTDDVLIVHRDDHVLVRGVSLEQVFNDVCDVIDLFYDWERTVRKLIGSEDALQKMLDASACVLRAPAFVYAPDGSAYALSREYPLTIHWHWTEIVANRGITSKRIRKLRDSIDLPEVWKDSYPRTRSSAMGAHAYMHCSLKPHGNMAGHFVLFGFEKPFYRGQERVVDILVKAMVEHMEQCYWLYNPTSQLAEAIVRFLAGNALEEKEVGLLLRALGWSARDVYRVYVVRERSAGEPVLLSNLLADISRNLPSAIPFILGDKLVAVENATHAEGGVAAEKVESLLQGEFACGVSVDREGVERCRELMVQAEREALHCLSTGVTLSQAKDHCPERLLERLQRDAQLELYVHPALLKLKSYDEANGSALYESLRAYVMASFHLSDAARYLGLHRNSLDYRLKRIREIADMTDIDALATRPDETRLRYLLTSFAVIDACAQRQSSSRGNPS